MDYIKTSMSKMVIILAVALTATFQLNAQYCASTNSNTADEWISNVTFAGINFNSGSTTYQNYTAQVANVTQGVSYPISVSITNGTTINYTETVRVWVDWNQNNTFDVATEQYDLGSMTVNANSTLVYSSNIAVPVAATLGTTRMRVTLKFSTYAGPCESFTWGEVEDYGVNVSASGPPPAPANDLCANAIPITCGTPISGTTVNATVDAVGTCTTTTTAPGVWYTIAGTGGLFTLDLCGASFDTKLSVFTGACGGLTCLLGNDDFCGPAGLQSQVSFTSVAGTTYYVLVHAYLSNTGAFTLNSNCAVPPPCPAPISGPWTVTAINGAGGSAITNCDLTHTVTANGAGTATADKIHFVHQTLSGNGYVVARIDAFTNFTFGGVAFRDGTAAGARKVALATQLGSRVTHEVRSTTNAAHTSRQLSAPKNNYVRIARAGDVFTSSVSSDGTNWTQVNSTTVAGLPSSMQVGFYVNSQLATLGTVNFGLASVTTGTPAATGGISDRNGNSSVEISISAFPNPASSVLNIRTESLAGGKLEMRVLNLLGQLVLHQNVDQASAVETLNISKLSTGVYMLQLNDAAPVKFVVER